MKRNNWQMLMNQYAYIREMDEDVLNAIDAWDAPLADDLAEEQKAREDALISILLEVLEDEKDSLTD